MCACVCARACEEKHQAKFTRQVFRGRGNIKPKGSDPPKVTDQQRGQKNSARHAQFHGHALTERHRNQSHKHTDQQANEALRLAQAAVESAQAAIDRAEHAVQQLTLAQAENSRLQNGVEQLQRTLREREATIAQQATELISDQHAAEQSASDLRERINDLRSSSVWLGVLGVLLGLLAFGQARQQPAG